MGVLPRKKLLEIWLYDHGSDRYEASEWMLSTMMDTYKRTLAFGLVTR